MPKKRALHAYCVEFSSHRKEGYCYNTPPHEPVVVEVLAAGVKEAINLACRKTLTRFVSPIPKQAANICWARDSTYEGTGYMSVQYSRGTRLSAPYYMTKRMTVEVTLGNIPRQLCFDFGDTH